MLSVSLNNTNTLGAASPHWLHMKLPHKYTSDFLAEPAGNVYLKLVFTFKTCLLLLVISRLLFMQEIKGGEMKNFPAIQRNENAVNILVVKKRK